MFFEVLIERKIFYLVFGGCYNLLIINYRYYVVNWNGNVFEIYVKLL